MSALAPHSNQGYTMRAFALASAGFLLLAATPLFAQTQQLPAAPVVTVGANLKELVFDWDPVPGAGAYWLLERTTGDRYFHTIGERISAKQTRATVPVAIHIQEWDVARYIVMACNPAGCTRSAEIFPRDQMLDAIGYLKASNTDPQDHFGAAMALSADGTTLAIAADQHGSANQGAVYVFRRSGRRWAQEALLRRDVAEPGDFLGGGMTTAGQNTLAISEDGSVLAVGAPQR